MTIFICKFAKVKNDVFKSLVYIALENTLFQI